MEHVPYTMYSIPHTIYHISYRIPKAPLGIGYYFSKGSGKLRAGSQGAFSEGDSNRKGPEGPRGPPNVPIVHIEGLRVAGGS